MSWAAKRFLKTVSTIICLGAFCLLVKPAFAYWSDGEELLKWCGSKPTEPGYVECIGYIQGHMDTALIGGLLSND